MVWYGNDHEPISEAVLLSKEGASGNLERA